MKVLLSNVLLCTLIVLGVALMLTSLFNAHRGDYHRATYELVLAAFINAMIERRPA